MSWTDLLEGSRQGLHRSLDRRAAKREGTIGRLYDAASRLGSQRFAASESALARGQETSEREAEQDYEAEQETLEFQRTQIREKLAMDHERAMAVDNREWQSEYQDEQNKFELLLEGARTTAEANAALVEFERQIDLLKVKHGIDLDLIVAEAEAESGLIEDRAVAEGGLIGKRGDEQARMITLENNLQLNNEAWARYTELRVEAESQLWNYVVDEAGNQVPERTETTIIQAMDLFKRELEHLPYEQAVKDDMLATFEAYVHLADKIPPDELASSRDQINVDASSSAAGDAASPSTEGWFNHFMQTGTLPEGMTLQSVADEAQAFNIPELEELADTGALGMFIAQLLNMGGGIYGAVPGMPHSVTEAAKWWLRNLQGEEAGPSPPTYSEDLMGSSH